MDAYLAEASTAIDAPLAVVWNVMLDVGAYDEWNPFIERIDAATSGPQVGDDLTLHVRWNDGKGTTTRERITRLEPPHAEGDVQRAALEYEFRGPLAALSLTRGRRLQSLEQHPGTQTSYQTRERLHGLLVRFVPMDKVRDGFQRHAAALKARAETLHVGTAE